MSFVIHSKETGMAPIPDEENIGGPNLPPLDVYLKVEEMPVPWRLAAGERPIYDSNDPKILFARLNLLLDAVEAFQERMGPDAVISGQDLDQMSRTYVVALSDLYALLQHPLVTGSRPESDLGKTGAEGQKAMKSNTITVDVYLGWFDRALYRALTAEAAKGEAGINLILYMLESDATRSPEDTTTGLAHRPELIDILAEAAEENEEIIPLLRRFAMQGDRVALRNLSRLGREGNERARSVLQNLGRDRIDPLFDSFLDSLGLDINTRSRITEERLGKSLMGRLRMNRQYPLLVEELDLYLCLMAENRQFFPNIDSLLVQIARARVTGENSPGEIVNTHLNERRLSFAYLGELSNEIDRIDDRMREKYRAERRERKEELGLK